MILEKWCNSLYSLRSGRSIPVRLIKLSNRSGLNEVLYRNISSVCTSKIINTYIFYTLAQKAGGVYFHETDL